MGKLKTEAERLKKTVNKKVLLGIFSILMCMGLIIVSSFVPFIIDPRKWQTKQFLTDELIICAIVIMSMVSVMFIGQASNAQNEQSRIAKSRVKFFDSLDKVIAKGINAFRQWIRKVLQPEDRQELTYTDTIEIIINVINTLITTITIALVAFTSLSLVVSCFMIAVITYISTMERVKEIGVIRSLGGRKRDVNRLFTAENFMTGLASGVLGIAVTYLLSAVINIVVSFFGVPAIAALPWWMALIMIGLSIFLNVISGFLPSRKAAKQDPVVALRTE